MTITITDTQFQNGETYGATIGSLIKTDRNGSRYYSASCPCERCGGKGIYIVALLNGKPMPSPIDDGVCYKCLGTGEEKGTVKVMKDEYASKLETAREAKAAAKAEEAERTKATREIEDAKRQMERKYESITRCREKHGDCSKCIHRGYCSIIPALRETTGKAKNKGIDIPKEIEAACSVDTESTIWENVKVVTLEGEPCETGRWFTDNFGNSKRCITKPNGEKVWSTASTDRGLKRYGLRTYDFEKEGALR